MIKQFYMNLDSLWSEGYVYTSFDVGGSAHSITINEENKEDFLDEWAKEWRKRAEEALVLVEVDADESLD